MAQLVLLAGLSNKRSSVTTTNNDSGTVLGGLDTGIKKGVGATGKRGEFKNTSRAVPEDGLGLSNSLSKEFSGLGSAVETHPVRGDTRLVSSRAGLLAVSARFPCTENQNRAYLGILVEFVGGDIVNREDKLDVVLLGLLNKVLDLLGASFVEQRSSNLILM